MTKKIHIYNDNGVGAFSIFAAQRYFAHDFTLKNIAHNITLVTASDIVKNGINDDIDLFVMPGGADRPYADKLKGAGNQAIKDYVENGGAYLGICAGGYYGCHSIEFQKGTDNEICEDRELCFFDGIGIGCLPDIAGQAYEETLKSATVTNIKLQNQSVAVLYWGGCTFIPNSGANYNVIANYEDIAGQPPAIISCNIGKGKAILSGVHFEVSKESLEHYDFDKSNDLKWQLSKQLKGQIDILQLTGGKND